VLPPSDPLARRKRAPALHELADRDWVLFGPDHGLSELVLGVCARAGFTPRRTVQTSQVAGGPPPLAAAGLGVTIVPDNVVPDGLNAEIRGLRPPLARQLVAFSRQDLVAPRAGLPRCAAGAAMGTPTALSAEVIT